MFPDIPLYSINIPTKRQIIFLAALMYYLESSKIESVSKGMYIDILKLADPETDLSNKRPKNKSKIDCPPVCGNELKN